MSTFKSEALCLLSVVLLQKVNAEDSSIEIFESLLLGYSSKPKIIPMSSLVFLASLLSVAVLVQD